jgi:hypothetical protein
MRCEKKPSGSLRHGGAIRFPAFLVTDPPRGGPFRTAGLIISGNIERNISTDISEFSKNEKFPLSPFYYLPKRRMRDW